MSMQLFKQEPLTKHTSLGIGGVCDFFCVVNTKAELIEILAQTHREQKSVRIIGHGTNVLVSDRGIPGLVIQLGDDFGHLDVNATMINVGAGCNLTTLVSTAVKHGLEGLEYCVGIPGTVGGAIAGNAGMWEHSISEFVQSIECITYTGQERLFEKNEIIFGYRTCQLPEKSVITRVILQLSIDNVHAIEERHRALLERRIQTQPYNVHSAGCVFKNPSPDISAGALIDQAGLKGLREGKVFVSDKHANFFIAESGASADDFMRLATKVQETVKKQFDKNLTFEIVRWGI